MPAITVYTDPLRPGRASMPTFTVGDPTDWSLNFNNGVNPWNPEGVYVKIGYIDGLLDGTYDNAFWLTDRMNFRYIGSFAVASSVPGTLTWDANPLSVEGTAGAYLVRGEIPPGDQVKKIYVVNPGIDYSGTPLVLIEDSGAGRQATAVARIVASGSGDVNAVVVIDPGLGYTTAPNAAITGGGATDTGSLTASVANGVVSGISVAGAGNGYTSEGTVHIGPPNGTRATATATLSAGTLAVETLSLVSGGSGYTSAPTVTISGGGGSSATADAVLAASAWGVKVASAVTGSGYKLTDSITISVTGGAGSGATVGYVISYPADGVWATTVTTGFTGSGYTLPPTVSFTGGGGTGAAGYAETFNGTVQRVVMTNSGSGYTSPPTVVFTPVSGGSGAAATTVLGVGYLTMYVDNPGSGYTSVPSVGITGGSGSGASLTLALIGSPVISLTLTAGGSGFTSNPSVSFSGGGGTGASATAALTGGGSGAGVASVAVDTPGMGYTTPPKVSVIPNLGTTLAVAGIETNPVCFISRQTPLNVAKSVLLTPYSRGRISSTGAIIYDDALIEIRPRLVASPTFTLQVDNLTWAATFNPVSQFVQAVLNFRRTCVVDFEVFGEGRCLLQSKLAIQAPIQ